MARQLSKAGEKVAMLTMIDSYPHTGPRPFRKRAHLAGAQLRRRVSDLMQLLADKNARVPLSRVADRRCFSDFLAWTRYHPRPYGGKVKFVRAEASPYPDPVPIWSRFAADFEVETVPGDHHTILSVHFADLAVPLTHHLKSAP
jgi:thioesterase domain-containing protein